MMRYTRLRNRGQTPLHGHCITFIAYMNSSLCVASNGSLEWNVFQRKFVAPCPCIRVRACVRMWRTYNGAFMQPCPLALWYLYGSPPPNCRSHTRAAPKIIRVVRITRSFENANTFIFFQNNKSTHIINTLLHPFKPFL